MRLNRRKILRGEEQCWSGVDVSKCGENIKGERRKVAAYTKFFFSFSQFCPFFPWGVMNCPLEMEIDPRAIVLFIQIILPVIL